MTSPSKHPNSKLDPAQAEAVAAYRQRLEAHPRDSETWAKLGGQLSALGQFAEAEDACRRALTLDPRNATGHFNLGIALSQGGDFTGAEPHFKQVLADHPRDLFARLALAECLIQTHRSKEALSQLEKVLAQDPGNTQAFKRIILIHHLQGNAAEVMKALEAWIKLDPTNPDRIWERGVTLLLQGRMPEGWADYEARLKVQSQARTPIGPFFQPRWDGSPFPGKTLLLHCEQGLGDTLMFIRFARLAKARGGRVVAVVQPQLRDLIATCEGVDDAVCQGDPLPPFDCYLPLMSLPGVFQIGEADIPADVPYLRIPPRVPNGEALKRILSVPTDRLRIGYAWAGSSGNQEDRSRSLDPAILAPLGAIPNTAWHCLQMPPPEACPFPSVPLSPLLTNFSDTAYALSHMDLVITVDTALAHLAGALGIPTFLMVRQSSEWRWQMNRSDSPWYPTLRIYRQPELGDWESVIRDIVADLTGGEEEPVPDTARGWSELAERLRQEGRLGEAVEASYRALELDADLLPAVATLGLALVALERCEEAETPLRHALERRPEDIPLRLAFVECLLRRGDLDVALQHLNRVLLADPRHFGALQRMLDIHTALRDRVGVIGVLDRWLAVAPERDDLRWERGTMHLMEGHYLQGWEDIEARFNLPDQVVTRLGPFVQPRWDGTPFPGKTLLLHCEQGLGDTLMFIRFARQVKALGGRVVAVVQPSLVSLISTCEGVDQAVANDAPWPPFDLQLPLMSLPRVLHIDEAAIPSEVPYLRVPPWTPNRSVLQEILSVPTQRLRIGYVWAGGSRHLSNAIRSVPLDAFARLGQLPQAAWHCFQVPNPPVLPFRSVPLSPLLTDFADTAYALNQMDLVITVDTAVAHLAGALGIPTFLMLPFGSEWRWQWDRQDSPWYPTLRIYRQPTPGDWDSVIDEMIKDLTQDQNGL